MNKFTALGLIDAAASGKRVMVITHDQRSARDALTHFETYTPLVDASVRRANGAEEIRLPTGGRILFRSARANLRGFSADILFLDDREELTADLVAVAAVGEIVRA